MKEICQYCGWEVPKPEWYNIFNSKPICNDCEMDMMLEKQKEMENIE